MHPCQRNKVRTSVLLATTLFIGHAAAQQNSGSELDDVLNTGPSEPAQSAPAPAAAPEPTASATQPELPTIPVEEIAPAARKRNALIEEIVVTAQKKEESINDVPIAINAFTGDALKTLGVTDTRDLANVVPGFTAADSGYNTPVYTLRGVGFNDSTYTATATVGVYVDEVSLPYAIMTKGAALDLERVEVLKGPQGILYGRNTTGGAINFIAKKPTEEFASGLSAGYARFGTTEVEGFINGKLFGDVDGRFAIKDLRSQQGWQYSNTRPGDTLGKQDKQSVRGSLKWAATDDLAFNLVLSGWRDASEPQAPQVIFVNEQNPNDSTGVFLPPQARNYPTIQQDGADPQVADWGPGRDWRLNDSFIQGALRTDWNLSGGTQFTSILSQMRVASKGSLFPQSGFNFPNAEQKIDAYVNTRALETRLSGLTGADETIDWMIGGNLSEDRGKEFHTEYVDQTSALFPDPVTGTSTLASQVYTQGQPAIDQQAAFFNVGWRFAEPFKLTAGGRYTRQQETYTGCSGETAESVSTGPSISNLVQGLSAQQAARYTAETGMPGDPDPQINKGDCFTLAENGSTAPFVDQLREKNFSYRLALDWKPVDEHLLYLSLGRGFKAGGYPVTNALRQSQYAPVTQEQLQAYEIGGKMSFFDTQLHTNFAAYYYSYKDKQLLTKVRDEVFGPLPILKNAPKSRVYGAELEIKAAPQFVEGLFLTATGAYTNTKVLEFQSLDNQGQPRDFAGRPFNFAPSVQYTLLVNQTWPLTEDLNLNLGGNYYHSSKTNSTLEQDPRFAHNAYGLLGAHIALSPPDRRWSVTFSGHNLLNEFYTLAVYQNGDAISRVAGRPRTYGLTLTYDWF